MTAGIRFLWGHHFRTNVEGKMRTKLKYSMRFDARARTLHSLAWLQNQWDKEALQIRA